MAEHFSPFFYYVKDPETFDKHFRAMRDALHRDTMFAADNLITFGRNLSFQGDERLMNALNRNAMDVPEWGIAWRTYIVVWFARNALRLPGDFVEAGCYKGTTVRTVCDATDFPESGKHYWLYDAFDSRAYQGVTTMPEHGPHLFEQVKARFTDQPNVSVIQGRIPEAFSQGTPEQIAFLHIDLNNAPAEIATLEALYDRVVPGGYIIFDDYGNYAYRAQKDAEDAWFARLGKTILELPTSQGILIK